MFAGAAAAGLAHLVGDRHHCRIVEEPLLVADVPRSPSLLVSYGYRHIVGVDVLRAFGGRAINLHISFLPWNRGADPNLWSWLEGTPKGVTIHWMTPELDRGEIIAQRHVPLDSCHTLRSSYVSLQVEMANLFREWWPRIERGDLPRRPQRASGTYHRSSDKTTHLAALSNGWDTPCAEVEEYGRRVGLWIGEPVIGDD